MNEIADGYVREIGSGVNGTRLGWMTGCGCMRRDGWIFNFMNEDGRLDGGSVKWWRDEWPFCRLECLWVDWESTWDSLVV